jgi:ABC-type lipopolysaccharide export system ATPase subunit
VECKTKAKQKLKIIAMILRAENLVKKYKSRLVVNDVSVYVEQGEIVGLLSPIGQAKQPQTCLCSLDLVFYCHI